MIDIKSIKNAQVFYGKGADGSPYRFKAWGDAQQSSVNDGWFIDCTDEGDYCYTFNQDDEHILYLTKEDVYK